jgi:hypothetical protein
MSLSTKMIYSITLLLNIPINVLAAAVPRQTPVCTFYVNAVGDLAGSILEDTIGEPRIGGNYPQNTYVLTDGVMTDPLNNICTISPNSKQLQCSSRTAVSTRILFSDNFYLMHNNTTNWLACPAAGLGNGGSYTIFSNEKEDKTGCLSIELRAGGFGCSALGRPSSTSTTAVATATPTGTVSLAARATTPSCPKDISAGIFQFPHLIVPTSPNSPNYAFGNSYTAYISPLNTTLFNFDIPATAPWAGTCSVVFQFPYADQLDPSAPKFYFSGLEEEEGEHGGLDFALLGGVATESTTYATTPSVTIDYGKTEIIPGTNYTIATFPCPTGTTTFSVSSKGNVELDFFQDSAPSAIGLYIVPCA